jgi:hypothetical protein
MHSHIPETRKKYIFKPLKLIKIKVGWAFYISKREREREKKQRSPQEIT